MRRFAGARDAVKSAPRAGRPHSAAADTPASALPAFNSLRRLQIIDAPHR